MNWQAVISQLDRDHRLLVNEATKIAKEDGSAAYQRIRNLMLISDILFRLGNALSAGLSLAPKANPTGHLQAGEEGK